MLHLIAQQYGQCEEEHVERKAAVSVFTLHIKTVGHHDFIVLETRL